MSWADGPMVAFDLETTGIDPDNARIVTASVVHIAADRSEEATAVHGITTEYATAFGEPNEEVILAVANAISDAWMQAGGVPVVIYNAPYDLTVLDRELRRHCDDNGLLMLTGHGQGIGPVIDPLVIDRALDRYRRGSRKLVDTCRHYGIELSEVDAHTSHGDAMAAARLAWKLAKAYPTHLADLDALQETQAVWYRQWAVHFQEYLRGKGSDEIIDTAWPVRPAIERVT